MLTSAAAAAAAVAILLGNGTRQNTNALFS